MIDALLSKVEAAIYISVAPLAINAWVTDEPVAFCDRRSGTPAMLEVGKPWAKVTFDCAWMRFTALLPTIMAAGTLVARIDINGELCLVDPEGVPARGLTCVKSTFERSLGTPAKTIYRLPPRALSNGAVELWGDAGLNDLFGNLRGGGVIALAEIAICREEIRQLYYDLETLNDFFKTLPPNGDIAHQLKTEFADIVNTLDYEQSESVAQARTKLRPWFNSGQKPAMRINAIGHAHLDLAWLWPIRETIRKGARSFATALYNIERYPEYIYGCSQPQLFAWLKRGYPALYAKIRSAVDSEQIEPLGNFWIEPDCNMPCGEAFVRQVLHGRRFFRDEFARESRLCWQPDVFGYHAQLPQILRKSGHEWFMTQKLSWNVVNRFPHHSFHWEGIDGTSIPVHMLVEETYNGPAAARSAAKIDREYAEREVSNHTLMVFGIGDGGGGPDGEHLERLRRVAGLPTLPTVTITSTEAFFQEWSKDAQNFPRWKGELYLERHQGTLTTQARVKRFNRLSEVGLREAEWASFLGCIYARLPYPAESLDRLWKEVLLYQFHDILPGSSIKRVYDECHERYAAILTEIKDIIDERYAALANRQANEAVVAFNSLSWDRTEWVRVHGAWHHYQVPALGWTTHASEPPAWELEADPNRLENTELRVSLAANGFINSIYDKKNQREFISEGQLANVWEIRQDLGDAWDFEQDISKKDVWKYLSRPIENPTLMQAEARIDGPYAQLDQTWSWKSCRITQRICLATDSRLISFSAQVNWQEPATMLRVRFALAVKADEARFEIPFGHLKRSTLEDTLAQRAQIEVAALQWMDLSEATHGVTMLNDCKHGFRVKGNVIDHALVRSVPHPHDGTMATNADSAALPREAFTDLGDHAFRYALWPHAGPGEASEFTRLAREFNTPLQVVAVSSTSPAEKPLELQPLKIDHPAIELAAVKPAEDGRGWIFRFVNVTEWPVSSAIDWSTPKGQVEESDLLERAVPGEQTKLYTFGPFEIKTLRWVSHESVQSKSGGSRLC